MAKKINRTSRSLLQGSLLIVALAAVTAIGWALWIAKPSEVPWSELLPAMIGGIIGALAGGIPAYFISRISSQEVLERDRAARVEQEKALAFRAHVRTAELVNGILSLRTQLEAMAAEAITNPDVGEHLWLVVRPIVGTTDDRLITVDAEEASIFVAAGEAEYVNDLVVLPKRHKAILEALAEYRRLRQYWPSRCPP